MARRAPEIPLRLFISLLAAIMVVGKIGEATAPLLLSRNSPILLLLLNANDINLVLTAAQCETRVATWAAVATLRRAAEDAAYFFFARAHGARARRGSTPRPRRRDEAWRWPPTSRRASRTDLRSIRG